jgi:hypothetical protein
MGTLQAYKSNVVKKEIDADLNCFCSRGVDFLIMPCLVLNKRARRRIPVAAVLACLSFQLIKKKYL